MKAQYYRIFIESTKQLSLFSPASTSKKELIYRAFNVRQALHFKSGSQNLAFMTHTEAGPYIIGSLAKVARINIQKSPEENFATESIESWPHVPVIINTDSDPESGQSIIIGFNKSIFKNPLVQLRALAKLLTNLSLEEHGYEIAINNISEKDDFWNHIKEYEGMISSLTFDFEAPNLFNTKDSLNDELREARDEFKMTHAQVKLENSSGELNIPRDSEFVNQGLQYISDGGGGYKIKLKNKRTVSSGDATKTTTIEETEFEIVSRDRSTLEAYCDKLFLWLKR